MGRRIARKLFWTRFRPLNDRGDDDDGGDTEELAER
jgi:hypothetical protein